MIHHDQRKSDYEMEPEMIFLHQFEWEGMISIRFESAGWKSESEASHSRRTHLVRALMNNLRSKWKLRKKDIYWVSGTEFGASGAAHCHVIFNFSHLASKGLETPDLTSFEHFLEESFSHICKAQKVPKRSIDFKWSPKYDDIGLVNYVCKKERGYDYKNFEWSDSGHKWICAVIDGVGIPIGEVAR